MAPPPTTSASNPSVSNPQTGPARTNKLLPLVPIIAAGIVGFVVGLANGIAGMIVSITVGLLLSVFYVKRMSTQQAIDALQKNITKVPFIMQIVYMIGSITFFSIFSVTITKGGLFLPTGHNPTTLMKYLSIIWVLPANLSKPLTNAFPGYPALIILATIIMIVGAILPERFLNKKLKPIIMMVGLIILTISPTITHDRLGLKGAVPWDYLPVFYVGWVGLIMVMVAIYLPFVLEKMGHSGKLNVGLGAGLIIPFIFPLLTLTDLVPPVLFITGGFESDHHAAACVLSGWVAALIGMHNASLAGKTTTTPPAKAPVPAKPPEVTQPDIPLDAYEPDTPPDVTVVSTRSTAPPPDVPVTSTSSTKSLPDVPVTSASSPVTPASGPVMWESTIDPNATPATNIDEGIGGGTTTASSSTPPGPKDGTVKAYKNPKGWGDDIELTYVASKGKWHDVNDDLWYNDLSHFNQYTQNTQDNTNWSQKDFQNMSTGHSAQDDVLNALSTKAKNDQTAFLQDKAKKLEVAKQDNIKKQIEDGKDSANWIEKGNSADNTVNVLGKVEGAADFGIDVLSKVGGKQGKLFKNIYSASKTVLKNVSESVHKDGFSFKSIRKGAVDGAKEALLDKAIDVAKDGITKYTGGKKFLLTEYKDYDLVKVGKVVPKSISQSLAKDRYIDRAIKAAVKDPLQGKIQSVVTDNTIKRGLGYGD